MRDMGEQRDIVDDYGDEQTELHDLLIGLDDDAFARPTPATGWDVRDQVAHLADTEEVALDTMTDGPRSLNVDAARFSSPEDFTESGCERGRAMAPQDVLEWWWTGASKVREQMRMRDRNQRVPWGLGMGHQAFVTARLMEHWAHGLDIRAALDIDSVDTDRLRHVAWICTRALPYAFGVADVTPPEGRTVRWELTAPNGDDTWSFGPDDATDVITGPAGEWCRRAVQRLLPEHATSLRADGPLAELAITHARAFL